MINLWKRFTAWLYCLRHPCTIITMDEAPAKGVDITFSYTGEYPTKKLTPQEERRIAIERWRNPFAKEDELQPKKQIDWPIGDHFEFGKPDTSMIYRFLEEEKHD